MKLVDPQLGRTYFAKDGNLHAGPGDFCPFDHSKPLEKRYVLPRVDVPGFVEVPGAVFNIIQGYLASMTLADKARAAQRRFKRSKLKYARQRF